jgi:hypothetical protein
MPKLPRESPAQMRFEHSNVPVGAGTVSAAAMSSFSRRDPKSVYPCRNIVNWRRGRFGP